MEKGTFQRAKDRMDECPSDSGREISKTRGKGLLPARRLATGVFRPPRLPESLFGGQLDESGIFAVFHRVDGCGRSWLRWKLWVLPD
jgi:hypothetical protein